MFLHDYLLACEISTVRTQTLRYIKAAASCVLRKMKTRSNISVVLDRDEVKMKYSL